jgi:hypothetical protein
MLAKRSARIRDFESESLDQPDALEAVLGCCAGDLMQMMLFLRKCLDEACSQDGTPLQQLPQIVPCIDQLGKISKQLVSMVEVQFSLQERRLLFNEIQLQQTAKLRSHQKKVKGPKSLAESEPSTRSRKSTGRPR